MSGESVFIIIISNNRKEDTLECLSSVEKSTYENQSIIVLDNASMDGSVEAIQNNFPRAHIISLVENRGYAGNNNVGIRVALAQGAKWVFILNDDTIMAPDCISCMIESGESHPKIGILGPMIYHYDEQNVIQTAGGILDTRLYPSHLGQNEKDSGEFVIPHYVDWISGCAILVRREVIEQVGLLDERFFCYLEETEWCLRAKRSGWEILHVPQAKLWHKGVQRNYHPSPSVTYYYTRNQFLLLSKHHASLLAWLSAWWQALRTLTSWTVRPKWRSMSKHRDAMWHGIIDFLLKRWGPMSSYPKKEVPE
jgi:GT2 family glycosyltransferase